MGDIADDQKEETSEEARVFANGEIEIPDLRRISPLPFLPAPNARDAIRDEKYGLLEMGKFGIPTPHPITTQWPIVETYDKTSHNNGDVC